VRSEEWPSSNGLEGGFSRLHSLEVEDVLRFVLESIRNVLLQLGDSWCRVFGWRDQLTLRLILTLFLETDLELLQGEVALQPARLLLTKSRASHRLKLLGGTTI